MRKKTGGLFSWQNLLYFVVCFIHERYMGRFLPLLLLAVASMIGKGLGGRETGDRRRQGGK